MRKLSNDWNDDNNDKLIDPYITNIYDDHKNDFTIKHDAWNIGNDDCSPFCFVAGAGSCCSCAWSKRVEDHASQGDPKDRKRR